MASRPQHYYTPEEYLALERRASYKSEYLGGEIFAMSGASKDHNRIAVNLVRHLSNYLEGRPCGVYVSDMRVKVSPTGLYTYPDVVVVCGPEEFEDNQGDTLLNPTVIFEVLSPSTEGYDRGAKFAQYWHVASLTDYVLVSQDQPRIEHYTRQGNGWFLVAFDGLDATLQIASIDCQLPLAAVYQNLEFPDRHGQGDQPPRRVP